MKRQQVPVAVHDLRHSYYSQIEGLHAAARLERSEYIHRLLKRAMLWLRAQLPGRLAAPRTAPCC